MGTSVRELKHAVHLQEWSVRVAECRSSKLGVKAWCKEQGIALKTYYNWERQIIREATDQYRLQASEQRGTLIQVKPDALPCCSETDIRTVITIRHGETEITLPSGSTAESIAELVKALNRHA